MGQPLFSPIAVKDRVAEAVPWPSGFPDLDSRLVQTARSAGTEAEMTLGIETPPPDGGGHGYCNTHGASVEIPPAIEVAYVLGLGG